MSTIQLLYTTTSYGCLPPIMRPTRMLWTTNDGSTTNACPNARMCPIVCTTRMLWTTNDGSTTNARYDARMCPSMRPTRMLRTPNDGCSNGRPYARYDARMCPSMRPTRMLWTPNDGCSNGRPNASMPPIMCSSLLRPTTTATNARLSTIMCPNGMLWCSYASHATSRMYAFVCPKLLYGEKINPSSPFSRLKRKFIRQGLNSRPEMVLLNI